MLIFILVPIVRIELTSPPNIITPNPNPNPNLNLKHYKPYNKNYAKR